MNANTLAHEFFGSNSMLNTPDTPILTKWQINFGIIDFLKTLIITFWDGINNLQNRKLY
jgi:hypothetical protein